MNPKKIVMIEKATELFAANGFEATSVQEITDACGISKGSFYLSFKSKESLLFSIFEYFTSKLLERFSRIRDLDTSPSERVKLFFVVQFEEIDRYSDFILMHMREQINPLNEEMLVLMNDVRKNTYEIQEKLLFDMYGEDIKKHIPDLSVLLSGLLKGYIEIIVYQKTKMDFLKLADYLFERLNSIVYGLSEPFLKKEQLIGFEYSLCSTQTTKEDLLSSILILLDEVLKEDIQISLEVIRDELSKDVVRKPVLLGMMMNLKNDRKVSTVMKKLKYFIEIT